MRNTPLKAFVNNDDKTKKIKDLIKNTEKELKNSQALKEEHTRHYNESMRKSRIKRGPQKLPKDLQ